MGQRRQSLEGGDVLHRDAVGVQPARVGPALQEPPRNVRSARLHCPKERRLAEVVRTVHGVPAVDEEVREVGVPVEGRLVQGRPALVVGLADAGTSGREQPHYAGVVLPGGLPQRGAEEGPLTVVQVALSQENLLHLLPHLAEVVIRVACRPPATHAGGVVGLGCLGQCREAVRLPEALGALPLWRRITQGLRRGADPVAEQGTALPREPDELAAQVLVRHPPCPSMTREPQGLSRAGAA
mmetsp:Transcript_50894/g.159531  ORF Transcript_50894/g.159531 Transcript_50894/m.159531 type:complete len:240 (+) Transcript_50894:293-1012(+)